MSRSVQLVLLCEDKQHEAFLRRFLEKQGLSTRHCRSIIAPPGKGSVEQFIRDHFPSELKAYRKNRHRVKEALVVMLDGDSRGVKERLNELEDACKSSGIVQLQPDERVAIFVPTWNLETWFAYLRGESVDEGRSDYPRLDRERDCREYVDKLQKTCRQGVLRQPAPSSLKDACTEWNTRLSAHFRCS